MVMTTSKFRPPPFEPLVGKGVREISSGGFHSLALAAGGDQTGGSPAGHVGAPYQPTKGSQRIGFATADGGEEEEGDGADRPQTGATGVTEESGNADTESRAASRMSARYICMPLH